MNNLEYIFDDIESCEEIGSFNDEFVYDIEMDDDSHTFIANDILVHNSLFVSFYPVIKNCQWKDNFFNDETMEKVNKTFIVLEGRKEVSIDNKNCLGISKTISEFKELLNLSPDIIFICGKYVKDRELNSIISEHKLTNIYWNWTDELDFIMGIDKFKFADYFSNELEKFADRFGVDNIEEFELERVSESIISLAKKKYIQHIVYEDGVPYDRFKYLFPKGVELVRSSTPFFAREKIIEIVKYLFRHPDDFNIKELLSLVKTLRKEFELANIDDIAMQSSCSNYESKVLDDKTGLNFVLGAHFAVKCSAYYNYLLHNNKDVQEKYEFIKSGTKIKYYYCKDPSVNPIFGYIRGSLPVEFAPEIDYSIQFSKAILSPINSIIEPLGMPAITDRLTIVMSIFGSISPSPKGLTSSKNDDGSDD